MQSGMVFIGIIAPLLAGFAVSAVSGRYLIPFLRRVKAGQTERTDGPQSHLSKTGTPNMGGIMILLGLAAACIIACFLPGTGSSEVIPVLILSIGFGLVGFIDDYLKVVKKKSDGLSAKQKMALQIVIALLFALYITKINAIPLTMKVPFAPGVYLDLKFLNIPALYDRRCLFRFRSRRGRRSDDRRAARFSDLQRESREGLYGRYGVAGLGRVCHGDGLPAAASAFHSDRRIHLLY